MLECRFRIKLIQRFYLIFVPLLLGVLLAVKVWALLLQHREPRWWDFAFLALVMGFIALAVLHLLDWFTFEVKLSDKGIVISGAPLAWENLESVQTKAPGFFSSFSALIELRSKDGRLLQIPACIQRSLVLLREIQKHIPD
jgi:hypothetical protein